MLLSNYTIKESSYGVKSHLNNIRGGPNGSGPPDMILFQVISSSPSEYDCDILIHKDKRNKYSSTISWNH